MRLLINGKDKESDSKNIIELLGNLKLNPDSVAVELNKQIIHRDKFSSASLSEDDKIEIVTVVGGG